MEITQVLEQSGLNQKQASVYLALLELGTASVQLIAQKAGLKRPTTYLVLDELEQKGLVSLVPQKKALYTTESPERLISDLNKKQEMLKRFLPDLLAVYNAKTEKPNIQLYLGKEGINQVYDKVFSAKAISFFGTISGISQVYPERLEQFLDQLKTGQISARELFSPTEINKQYVSDAKSISNYEIRFIKSGMELPTDCAIFDDTVVMFFFKPQLLALVIKNKEFSVSLQTLYDLAWSTAEKV